MSGAVIVENGMAKLTECCRFVLQLVSLAGLHLNATATWELASRFKTDGMLAYVDLVQKKEKALGCDVLTHQKWYVVPLPETPSHNAHDSV